MRTSSTHYHNVRPTPIEPDNVYTSLTLPITYDSSAYLDSSAFDNYSTIDNLQLDDTYENIVSGYEYSDDDEYMN